MSDSGIKIERHSIVYLGIDTMVMDNDSSKKKKVSKLVAWEKFRRAIFTKLQNTKSGQLLIEFDKPSALIYTNIGNSKVADALLIKVGYKYLFNGKEIIKCSHGRAADELIHRSIKELATKENIQGLGMCFWQ